MLWIVRKDDRKEDYLINYLQKVRKNAPKKESTGIQMELIIRWLHHAQKDIGKVNLKELYKIKMSRIAKINWNDIGNGPGVNVSVFMQGCHFHCRGCFNQSTWDFNGGFPADDSVIEEVLKGISKNNVKRNLSILGGEPLAPENRNFVASLVKKVREKYPDIEIWMWTGYELADLLKENDASVSSILSMINSIITGRFILEQRDLTLRYMGSRNQKLLRKGINF